MAMTRPISEQVTFTQEGAGAVERLASDKLREWVSVKDFGAVGDGVADDTAAIQAAIESARGSGFGSTVLIPKGRYRVTAPIKLRAFVKVSGHGATILVDFDGAGFVGGVEDGADPQYLYVEGLYLEGVSSDVRPNQSGILWKSVFVNSFIRDVSCISMGGRGVVIDTCNAIVIENCYANNIRGDACLYLRNSSAVSITGGAYEGAQWPGSGTTFGATGKAIHIDNSAYGDYAPNLLGVQVERSAYGVYANYCRGLRIYGLNAHYAGLGGVAMVYLSSNTTDTIIQNIFGGDYAAGSSYYIVDAATGNNVNPDPGSGRPISFYCQSEMKIAGDIQLLSTGRLQVSKLGAARNGATHMFGAVQIEQVSLADDTVYTFSKKAGNGNNAVYVLVNNDRAFGHAIFSANSTNSPTDMANSGNISYGSAVLTNGTGDGVDGDVNIFPASATTIGIKNRLGFTSRFTLYIFSSTTG